MSNDRCNGYVSISDYATVLAKLKPWHSDYTYRREVCVAGFTCVGCGRPQPAEQAKHIRLSRSFHTNRHQTSRAQNKHRFSGVFAYLNSGMHIGNKIKEVLQRHPKDHTVTWFAQQLNCHRVNVYDIFSRQTIDTELLWRISIILDHDFFQDISIDIQRMLKDEAPAPLYERRGH